MINLLEVLLEALHMCENFFWKVDYFHQGWTIKIFEIYNIVFLGRRLACLFVQSVTHVYVGAYH